MRKVLMFLFQLRNEFPSAQIELLTYPVIRARTRNTVPTNEFFMDINSLDRRPSIGPLSTFVGNYFALGQKFEEESSAEAEGSPLMWLRPGEPLRFDCNLFTT